MGPLGLAFPTPVVQKVSNSACVSSKLRLSAFMHSRVPSGLDHPPTMLAFVAPPRLLGVALGRTSQESTMNHSWPSKDVSKAILGVMSRARFCGWPRAIRRVLGSDSGFVAWAAATRHVPRMPGRLKPNNHLSSPEPVKDLVTFWKPRGDRGQ